MPRKKNRTRRGWGAIRTLPSGRVQASYSAPNLERVHAPRTFETRLDAEGWLVAERRLIDAGTWTPPAQRAERSRRGRTLSSYGAQAIDARRVKGEPLKPRTRALYLSIWHRLIEPDLGHSLLGDLTPEDVRKWHDSLDRKKPTQRAHAYALLRTIMSQAVEDRLVATNPCRVKGAGVTRRVRRIEPASPQELVTITAAMPDRLRLFVVLAAWCGLRYGELAELRRADLKLSRGVLAVSRAVTRVNGEDIVSTPKSEAGAREVAIPPHVLPIIEAHLDAHVRPGRDALLFPRPTDPQRHLNHKEFTRVYSQAREAAGRPDLRLHDLRHTHAVYAAQAGATIAELMARLGHSTPGAALRYQHAAKGRDRIIADAMSQAATCDLP